MARPRLESGVSEPCVDARAVTDWGAVTGEEILQLLEKYHVVVPKEVLMSLLKDNRGGGPQRKQVPTSSAKVLGLGVRNQKHRTTLNPQTSPPHVGGVNAAAAACCS